MLIPVLKGRGFKPRRNVNKIDRGFSRSAILELEEL
jgi:hypothetical protein